MAWPGVAGEAGHGADVDDLARLLLHKVTVAGLDGVEHALQVDVQHRIPVRLGHGQQHLVPGDTGIVDQNIHAAQLGHHVLDGSLGVLEVGHVTDLAHHPAAHGLNGGHSLLSGGGVAHIENGNVGTLGGQLLGRWAAPMPWLPPVTSATFPSSVML